MQKASHSDAQGFAFVWTSGSELESIQITISAYWAQTRQQLVLIQGLMKETLLAHWLSHGESGVPNWKPNCIKAPKLRVLGRVWQLNSCRLMFWDYDYMIQDPQRPGRTKAVIRSHLTSPFLEKCSHDHWTDDKRSWEISTHLRIHIPFSCAVSARVLSVANSGSVIKQKRETRKGARMQNPG